MYLKKKSFKSSIPAKGKFNGCQHLTQNKCQDLEKNSEHCKINFKAIKIRMHSLGQPCQLEGKHLFLHNTSFAF